MSLPSYDVLWKGEVPGVRVFAIRQVWTYSGGREHSGSVEGASTVWVQGGAPDEYGARLGPGDVIALMGIIRTAQEVCDRDNEMLRTQRKGK